MQVNGTLFGPIAEETGGVFHGMRNGANSGGAFGATYRPKTRTATTNALIWAGSFLDMP
jgi:hypothetical protein